MKRITISLDPDLIAELDQVAREANVSRAWMGREILRYTLRGLPMPALFTLPEYRPGEKVGATGSDIVVPINPPRQARPDPKGKR